MAYFQQHHQQAPYHQHHHQQQPHYPRPQQQQPMMMQGGFTPHHPYAQQQQQYQQQQQHQPQPQYQQQYGNHNNHHHNNNNGHGHDGHNNNSNNSNNNNNGQFYPPQMPPMMMMMMMETEEDRLEAQAADDLLDADSTHEMMLPVDYVPCPETVIVGRGKKVAQHPGNVRFRELVKQELAEYSAATTKAHKSSIIVRVLTQVRQRSLHSFVKQNLTTLRWYRVEETAQRITTAQAFRDALKDNYKSSRAFKKLKREEEKKTVDEKPKGDPAKKDRTKKTQDANEMDGSNPDSPPTSPMTSRSSSPKVSAPNSVSPIPGQEVLMEDDEEEVKEDKGKPTSAETSTTSTPPPKTNQAALDKMRAMLEAQQSDFTAGNFTWWKPEVVKPRDTPTSTTKDKKMPPPSGRRDNNRGTDTDAIPSTSVASCSSLLWSNHSKFSDRPSRRKENPFNFNSNHTSMSGLKWSNHSIMTISGHSTRSNGTFNGLLAKYAGDNTSDRNPFEPRPIAISVQENDADMDMELDCVLTSTAEMEASANSYCGRTQPYSAKSTTTFDEGIAMGLGNLSDHSSMSNMSSIHSIKFTAEEIFADTPNYINQQPSKGQRACYPGSSRYRGAYNVAMST
jgi:hypothetical protein